MIDINKIKKFVDEGYISERMHPTCEYKIYNYTPKATYDFVWNEQTLNCRGLILDEDNNVIGRGMKKFFNYSEYGKDSKLGELPTYKSFDVYEKLDGSLIIITQDKDKNLIVATRGSFESEQAKVAGEILKEKYPKLELNPSLSYLFEVIYPENKIVIDYGNKRDLVLLTIIDNTTGKDIKRNHIESFARTWAFPLVNQYNFSNNLNELLNLMNEPAVIKKEGYVVQFDNGLRVKLKYNEYVRLHRLVTGLNTKAIWELLKDGKSIEELLDKVPKDFNKWVKKKVRSLENKYFKIEDYCKSVMDGLKQNKIDKDNRKEVAQFIKLYKYPSVSFAMFDKKDYSKLIWRNIKPKYSKPFKEEI